MIKQSKGVNKAARDRQVLGITRKMVNAGVRYARASGFLDFESSADQVFVQKILEAALAVQPDLLKSFLKHK